LTGWELFCTLVGIAGGLFAIGTAGLLLLAGYAFLKGGPTGPRP
jgi:hypothetical protein